MAIGVPSINSSSNRTEKLVLRSPEKPGLNPLAKLPFVRLLAFQECRGRRAILTEIKSHRSLTYRSRQWRYGPLEIKCYHSLKSINLSPIDFHIIGRTRADGRTHSGTIFPSTIASSRFVSNIFPFFFPFFLQIFTKRSKAR